MQSSYVRCVLFEDTGIRFLRLIAFVFNQNTSLLVSSFEGGEVCPSVSSSQHLWSSERVRVSEDVNMSICTNSL